MQDEPQEHRRLYAIPLKKLNAIAERKEAELRELYKDTKTPHYTGRKEN